MCIPNRQLGPKARHLRAVANISLILGLTPWIFREYIPLSQNWLHAVCGFLLGLFITINLFWLRRARRYRDEASKSYRNRARSSAVGTGQISSRPQMRYRQRAISR